MSVYPSFALQFPGTIFFSFFPSAHPWNWKRIDFASCFDQPDLCVRSDVRKSWLERGRSVVVDLVVMVIGGRRVTSCYWIVLPERRRHVEPVLIWGDWSGSEDLLIDHVAGADKRSSRGELQSNLAVAVQIRWTTERAHRNRKTLFVFSDS